MVSIARTVSCFIVAGLLVLAVNGSAVAGEHVVNIVGLSFSPQNLVIPTGDTVRWVNNSGLFHTATSGTGCTADGTFNGSLNNGTFFTFTFSSEGIYPYYCVPHCFIGMVGTISVESPVPVRGTTWGGIKALYVADSIQ